MLQMIIGRAGSGKTEYIFNSMKNQVEQGDDSILLITPEQFSFISERRLLTDLGEDKVNCVENGSFSRLSSDIAKKYGSFTLPMLSKGAKAVLFKKACDSCKDELKLFSKNVNNNAFISSAVRIYDEMKACRVSYDDIISASNNADKVILSEKLHDIALIMSEYDNLIKDKYTDPAEELTYLYEKLLTLDYFKGRTVYIDGFSGFVAQEYKIIEVILKQAKSVYITFCSDSPGNNDEYDLFSYVNSNIEILTGVAKKENVKILPPVYLTENHRAKNDELRSLEKNMYFIKTPYEKEVKNISIFRAKSIVDECNYVSSEISKLMRQGINPSDITVICRDLDKYQRELQFSFSKYNIPYFDDERQSISSQPCVMFINFLFRVCAYYFRSDDIFSLLKTGLTALDTESISTLENYAFMWNINGTKWKSNFTESTRGFVDKISDSDKKALDEINKHRDYVISRLEKFSKSVKNTDAKGISRAIYYTLLDFSVDKKIKELAVSLDKSGKSALAVEQGRVWDLIMNILNELAVLSLDEKVSIKEYSKLFNLMIANEDLGNVPIGLDNVQLGSADRIRCNNPYACFVLGANDGEFPQNVSSSGLLTEADRVKLIDDNFKLYSYGETLNAQERYFAYMAVSCGSNRLYVSYRNSVDDTCESSIVSEIKDTFPAIETKSNNGCVTLDSLETDANAFEFLASDYDDNSKMTVALKQYFSDKKEFENRLDAVNNLSINPVMKINNKDLARKLFKNDMYLSASRIEDYYNCAFRYFCKFGLNVRPRTKAEMNAMQTGTVIHFVLEHLVKDVTTKTLVTLDRAQVEELTKKYLKLFFDTKMGDSEQLGARFKYRFMRLSKMLTHVVLRLRDEFMNSDFEAKAFELSIGDGSENEEVKSKTYHLSDGGTIRIKGSIDRVDTYTENGIQYVRVVDYKSGTKDFVLSDILHGLNLQMFVYLFTLCESDNELSGVEAGVLYMHAARKVYNTERNVKNFNKSDNDEFRMKGIVLNDESHSIAEHMDRELSNKYIPVSVSNGELKGNIVSLADLGRISKKINELIVSMGDNLHMGYISQNPADSPHHDKTCEYCDYKDVCMNKKEIIPNLFDEPSFEETIKILKEDEENA